MLVRRITNSIRPVVMARLLGNGEAQTFDKKACPHENGERKPIKLRGSVIKR